MLQNEHSLLSLLATVHDCDYENETKSLTLWLSADKLKILVINRNIYPHFGQLILFYMN